MLNRTIIASVFFLFLAAPSLWANEGYEIKVSIDGYEGQELLLGHYLLDKQYINDTVARSEDGAFVFKGDEALPVGVYIVVLPPENNFFQILINDGEQKFNIKTSFDDLVGKLKVSGSKDNQLFYEYLNFLNEQRPKAEKVKKEIDALKEQGVSTEEKEKELDKINNQVDEYRNTLIEKHPKSLAAVIAKSTLEVKIPEYEGDEKDVQMKRYLFFKKHYFDYYDLGDERLLRSPVLFNRVNYYIEKLTLQHPDSISLAIDYILGQMQEAEENFKYYLVHFLNTYAKSKIVGMDAVYVHIVDNYYAKGLATWTEDEQLTKIVENADKLRPILIGKNAPDINMQVLDIQGTIEEKDSEDEYKRFKTSGYLPLHNVESPYTVLIFWAPDCGHCKKSMPKVFEFYEKFKDKGVFVYSVCAKTYKDMPMCAEYIKDKELRGERWINLVDPYLRTKYKKLYNVETTPQIFILDENKEILSKRIAGEQIEEVLTNLMKVREQEQQNENKSKP